ncbi:MAG: cation-transporting P-type ATPase [Gammaproteobacteria bacterium]|nr:cation-transporting P-type ATPase [Gammaproteobacteria bacterium]
MDSPQQVSQWHGIVYEAVLTELKSGVNGLSSDEAATRLTHFGANRLTPPPGRSALRRFLQQFHNVLIYVLLVTGVVTALLGHWTDSGVILLVVVINALIGFIQEGKAEKAMEAISQMLANQTLVRRDDRVVTLDAVELVPGDIVVLQSGDRVPADLRLVRSRDLRIDEALLTGESVPAEKDTAPVEPTASVADRHCMAYSGSFVTSGQGSGVVVATGDETEIGRISGLLGGIEVLMTPLLRQMADFALKLSIAILIFAVATFLFGLLVHDYTPTEMFLAAVGLAVAAIPEGLPAIMTITLAIGVQRMAQRNAIIRRLPAVETLGSVTVICSDKTGTLTRNEMTVQTVATADGLFEVSGVGYDPHGGFTLDGAPINPEESPLLQEIARGGLLCNDANLTEQAGQWQLHGDPTEGALLTLGLKAGLEMAHQQQALPRSDVLPFASSHRFMATLHHDHHGHAFIYVKGAPERVFEMCRLQRVHGTEVALDRAYWEARMEQMATRGQRLIAIAFKPVDGSLGALNYADVDNGLSLLGVVGIIDPPREEATRAVALCRSAGIRVKMITGDHEATARAIGAQMGIGDGRQSVSGAMLDEADEDTLGALLARSDIFARTSPEQKLRLVEVLQSEGEVVAMTGDGVNDAPALKRADVGMAMGQKGTEVAKEAAEMVLADDNFASIVDAVREGRTVYDNLKKSIMFILPTNGGEAVTIIAAITMGRMLPITAAQILWVNMITAVTLALALAFEPAEPNIMQRRPRGTYEPLLSRFLVWRIVFVSLILAGGTFGMFLWQRLHDVGIDEARTIAVNTLVMFEIFYLFSARYLIAPALTREGLLGNRYALLATGLLLIMQLAFTYAPPMQALFATTPLSATTWLTIIAVASSVLFLVELEKWWLRWRERRRPVTAGRGRS